MNKIQQQLYNLQDKKYRNFQIGLCPTVAPDTVIGVRTPAIRAMAKDMIKNGEHPEFLSQLPHQYFEENQLHAFIISEMKNYDDVINCVQKFLPYVDNWGTCDQLRPKVFKKNRDKLIGEIDAWLESPLPYTIRFGVEMLTVHYLDEDFREEYLEKVSKIRSEEYYVNMMLAWYFATALAMQYDVAMPYITEKRLDPWVHNKTIQKAVESYRITEEQKEFLKTFRLKKKSV